MASLLGGIVYDAGSGSYAGVMVVFVTVTVVSLIAATGVPVGTGVDVAGAQTSAGQRWVLVPPLAVSARVLKLSESREF